MFTMQKYGEFLDKSGKNDTAGASAAKKLHGVMKKCADDEWAKFLRIRY